LGKVSELFRKTARGCEELSAGVVRDETGDAHGPSVHLEVPRAVERVETGDPRQRAVPDVVQPCGGDEDTLIGRVDGDGQLLGPVGHCLRMDPPVGQRVQKVLGPRRRDVQARGGVWTHGPNARTTWVWPATRNPRTQPAFTKNS